MVYFLFLVRFVIDVFLSNGNMLVKKKEGEDNFVIRGIVKCIFV